MLTEEYGLPYEVRSPWIAALSTFSSFFVCGLIPLLPYLLQLTNAFVLSVIGTRVIFFAIGSAKSRWSTTSWLRSGLVTFLVGAIAGSWPTLQV